jgi:hypothetical protein
MKALQIIAILCIASSFHLNAMDETDNEKKITQFTGIDWFGFDKVWRYCSVLPWRKNDQDCITINAYLLLNRFPNNSVEEQVKYHERNLSDTTKKLDAEITFLKENPETVLTYQKSKLKQRKLNQESIITEIKKANLAGKIQDEEIQDKFNTSFNNIVKSRFRPTFSYELQLKRLNTRIEFQQFLGTPHPDVINDSKS